jgi:hypothetical protein
LKKCFFILGVLPDQVFEALADLVLWDWPCMIPRSYSGKTITVAITFSLCYVHGSLTTAPSQVRACRILKTIKDVRWNMDFAPAQQGPSNAYRHGMHDGSGNVGGGPATMQEDTLVT